MFIFSVKIFHFTLWTLTNVQNDSLLTHQHNFLYHIEYVHVTTKCIYVWFFGFLYKPIKANLTIISKFLFRNSSNLNLSPIFFSAHWNSNWRPFVRSLALVVMKIWIDFVKIPPLQSRVKMGKSSDHFSLDVAVPLVFPWFPICVLLIQHIELLSCYLLNVRVQSTTVL